MPRIVCAVMGHGRGPTLTTPIPIYQLAQQRNYTSLFCIIWKDRVRQAHKPRGLRPGLRFLRVCVVGKESTSHGACAVGALLHFYASFKDHTQITSNN